MRLAALAALMLLPAAALPAARVPAPIEHAVDAPSRTQAARELDESRHPGAVLAYLGLKPGMHAADFITGTGYWAEIMGLAVGRKGRVTAFSPRNPALDAGDAKAWSDLLAREPTITPLYYDWAQLQAPTNAFDFAIINNSYHDLYFESAKYGIPRTDPRAFASTMFAAMKHGGIVGVIDHQGPAGDTRAIVAKLHRISPATVRADFEAAGFEFVGQSDLLANTADDHTLISLDDSFHRNTDRFILKFVKA